MPTGYTAFIEDGEITTGKDFLMLCLRNFGIEINMRDESLNAKMPDNYDVNPYHKKQLEAAEHKLDRLQNMTDDEIERNIIESNQKEVELDHNRNKNDENKLSLYKKVRYEVEAWIPPTDEHKGVKEFALQQIDMCIDDINSMKKYYANKNKAISSISEWREAEMQYILQSIEYHTKGYRAEIERTKSKNEWLQKFKNSF